MSPQNRDLLARVLDWLRQGYPEGVGRGDYVALLGVLRRRLTDEEIDSFAAELASANDSVTEDDIHQLIREQALLDPKKKDVARVSDALAEEGVEVEAEDSTEGPAGA